MPDPIPMTDKPHTEWFHGSPSRLKTLLPGSTVTPVRFLAMAFSHKPRHLEIEITEDEETGKRHSTITHDGNRNGYLYRVMVRNPEEDLVQHPDSKGAGGEEMLTTRPLELEFLEEVPLEKEYRYIEE